MKRNPGHWDAGLRRRVRADTSCRSMQRAFLIALGTGALASEDIVRAAPGNDYGFIWPRTSPALWAAL